MSTITSTTPTSPTMPSPLTLTLIVAATSPSMGIGLRGTLPWTGLKREMAYFAWVTKRPPSLMKATRGGEDGSGSSGRGKDKVTNAVIMGRKTWLSIPPRFRPLAGRINVVVSRHPENLHLSSPDAAMPDGGGKDTGTVALGADSLPSALRLLDGRFGSGGRGGDGGEVAEDGEGDGDERVLGKVFVIGGAEIYRTAMEMRETRRILLTRVLGKRREEGEGREEVECDTFFPVDLSRALNQGLSKSGDGVRKIFGSREQEGSGEWRRCGKEEFDQWVGEEVPGGLQKEGGVEYEFCMFERA
ncbi:MAG: dihydrofolate reductase [Pycnora praestabilis]|nr:MAG: dihydrofolate reductase [Pycnora praestabilis]